MWECNWPTFELFVAMGTQWSVGMGGATGMRYEALPVLCRAMRIRLTRRRLAGIQEMERAALAVMGERRK